MTERPGMPQAESEQLSGQPPRHLFVYGTLLSSLDGTGVPSLQGWTTLIGRGRVVGCLYDTGEFPAAVLSGEGTIRGELHAIHRDRTESLLDLLDAYEQYFPGRPHASLFVRLVTEVKGEDGETRPAWIYCFNREVTGLTWIESGDYEGYSAVDQRLEQDTLRSHSPGASGAADGDFDGSER
jgi:gamma-glutamylcyclotransferase (GGCT)/AIG2-like uncharacterized protein YtfP